MKKRKIKRHCVHDRNAISLWKLVWVLHHQPTTTLYPFKLSNVRVRLTQWNRWRQNEKLLCFGFEHHCLHSSSSSFFYFFSPAFISDLTMQRCLRLSDSNLWLCDDLMTWAELSSMTDIYVSSDPDTREIVQCRTFTSQAGTQTESHQQHAMNNQVSMEEKKKRLKCWFFWM